MSNTNIAVATLNCLEEINARMAGVFGLDIIPSMLRLMRSNMAACAVKIVFQDSVHDSSEGDIWADPPEAQPHFTISCALIDKALTYDEILLLDSIIILPLSKEPSFRAAAVIFCDEPIHLTDSIRAYLHASIFFLRSTLPSAARLRTAKNQNVAEFVKTLPQAAIFLEEHGALSWFNPEAARLLGLEADVSTDRIVQAMERLREAAEAASDEEWIWTLHRPELRILSVVKRCTSIGEVPGHLWLFADITEQRNAELELRSSEDRYKELFENSPLPAWVYDTATLAFLAVNRAAVKQYGYTREEFLAMTLAGIRPPEEVPKLLSSFDELLKTHQKSGPWRHRKKDGGLMMVEISSHQVSFPGHPARLVMVNDITERNVAEQRFRDQEERWQLALRGCNDGLWDYDITNHQVFYSRRWKEMLGYEDNELPNAPEEWEIRVHPDDLPVVQAKLHDHFHRRALFYVAEYRMRCQDGSYKWVLARGQAVWNEEGKPVRMVGSHTDITERKQSEARLTRDALYDSLTGLMNRRYLLQELDRAVQRAEDQQQPLSLALGDLDHFKEVNDSHGHAGGDEVLAVVGQIMQQGQRQGDVVGRIGGDEFCMLFPRTSVSEAALTVERTRSRLATMAFGVSSGVPFTVSATFGVASWQPGMRGKDLLIAADRALYQAKERGRNRLAMV